MYLHLHCIRYFKIRNRVQWHKIRNRGNTFKDLFNLRTRRAGCGSVLREPRFRSRLRREVLPSPLLFVRRPVTLGRRNEDIIPGIFANRINGSESVFFLANADPVQPYPTPLLFSCPALPNKHPAVFHFFTIIIIEVLIFRV